MYKSAESLDDLLRAVLSKLLRSKEHIRPTKGSATELTGVMLRLTRPRARLSRTQKKGTLFSCIGELLWYLSQDNSVDFITYYLSKYSNYSDDGLTLYGAYGPRLFNNNGIDQVRNVIALLKRKSYSRQAVIQLFDAVDITKQSEDVPCTCILQFMIRKRRLHMVTYMRSNDAFIGLPHDIFAFTMLQEILARTLQTQLGIYFHLVGSLHLYERDRANARLYLKEGWQTIASMPPMPRHDPWPAISKLLEAEERIRCGQNISISRLRLDNYWADLVRLLKIYARSKVRDRVGMARLARQLSIRTYAPYVQAKIESIEDSAHMAPQQ